MGVWLIAQATAAQVAGGVDYVGNAKDLGSTVLLCALAYYMVTKVVPSMQDKHAAEQKETREKNALEQKEAREAYLAEMRDARQKHEAIVNAVVQHCDDEFGKMLDRVDKLLESRRTA